MKANEMRIGNLVKLLDGTIFTIGSIEEKGFTVQNEEENTWIEAEEFESIPLTEEWLLKFGFKYDTDNDKLLKFLPIHEFCTDRLSFRKSEGHICLQVEQYRTLTKHVKHVHQLQNLYFALTGAEITIGGNNE